CGGGVPWRGLRDYEELLRDDVPGCDVKHVSFEAPSGAEVTLTLSHPLRIFSRRELDARWSQRADRAGARLVTEKVVSLERLAVNRLLAKTSTGREEPFD